MPTEIKRAKDPESVLSQGKYYGRQTIILCDRWQPIASLSFNDNIIQFCLTTEGRPEISSEAVEIQYSRRDDLYYIRRNRKSVKSTQPSEQVVTLHFALDTSVERTSTIQNELIRNKISEISSFKSGEIILLTHNPSAKDIMSAMSIQKVGACRHRAVVLMNWMKENYPEIEVRCIMNDCHAFIELKEGGLWFSCDLGGYPAELDITEYKPGKANLTASTVSKKALRYVSARQKKFEEALNNYSSHRHSSISQDPLYYCQQLITGINKKILGQIPSAGMTSWINLVERYAYESHHSVFYVHSAEDLVCSVPVIRREGDRGIIHEDHEGAGPLYDFMMKEAVNRRIILVNYSRFSTEEIVRQALKALGQGR
jgi:hypothetical protein